MNQFITEEVHENLPVNSLLLDDGTLIRLPNFNRRYEVFDVGCSGSYPSCHSTDIHQMVYTKLNDDSQLHVKWYSTIDTAMWETGDRYQSMKWFITINGQSCSDPGPIEIWHARKGTVYGFQVIIPKTRKCILRFEL